MEMWSEIDSPNIQMEMSSRLNRLRTSTYDDLKALPDSRNETVAICGEEVVFTTYRDLIDNEELEIVLQASRLQKDSMLAKRGQVAAEGFRITPNGKILPLPEGTIYYYK